MVTSILRCMEILISSAGCVLNTVLINEICWLVSLKEKYMCFVLDRLQKLERVFLAFVVCLHSIVDWITLHSNNSASHTRGGNFKSGRPKVKHVHNINNESRQLPDEPTSADCRPRHENNPYKMIFFSNAQKLLEMALCSFLGMATRSTDIILRLMNSKGANFYKFIRDIAAVFVICLVITRTPSIHDHMLPQSLWAELPSLCTLFSAEVAKVICCFCNYVNNFYVYYQIVGISVGFMFAYLIAVWNYLWK